MRRHAMPGRSAVTSGSTKARTMNDVAARGDGILNHDIDPGEKRPQDACGVFGVWAAGEQVAKLTYFGLYALQHRGQEAAGIAVSDGSALVVYKDLGLVSQVFDEATLATLQGHIASATRATRPPARPRGRTPSRAFAPRPPAPASRSATTATSSTPLELFTDARAARRHAAGHARRATTDSDLLTALLAARPDVSVEQAAMEVLPKLRGAFSLVFMDEHTLYAARDPQGVRPLVLGRLERGWVVTSETAALDIVGASFVREIEPGELVAIDEDGLRSPALRQRGSPRAACSSTSTSPVPTPRSPDATCTRPASRSAAGWPRSIPADADLVIPVPESGTPAAIGYAEASGIPYGTGLVKNAYVGRTFIQPSQTIRQLGIRLKLNPLRDVIRGKRLVVVDDSIVRGNTQRALVRMLREAGAVEVHVRISSPPVKWPCFYGIDFATNAELIANSLDIEGIRASIGADSLGYVSLDGTVAASEQPYNRLCCACFDGSYPIELPEVVGGKHVLEGIGRRRRRWLANPSTSRGYSAEDALTRP